MDVLCRSFPCTLEHHVPQMNFQRGIMENLRRWWQIHTKRPFLALESLLWLFFFYLRSHFWGQLMKKIHKACLKYPSWKKDHEPARKPWLYPEQCRLPTMALSDLSLQHASSLENIDESGLMEARDEKGDTSGSENWCRVDSLSVWGGFTLYTTVPFPLGFYNKMVEMNDRFFLAKFCQPFSPKCPLTSWGERKPFPSPWLPSEQANGWTFARSHLERPPIGGTTNDHQRGLQKPVKQIAIVIK